MSAPQPVRDAPARFGRYELLGHLATGGMAEIHLARVAGEGGFEKTVVVKRLLPELVASPAYVAMFLDEGKLVARLDHPNICEVHDLGREGAEYYLAMPFLDGIPVHDLIARPRDPDRAAQLRVAAGVIVQACEGLHHAHELRDSDGAPTGLVHRDISPSNLFVTSSGVVKVLDFGIAKVRGSAATELGMIKGKAPYMAPEQVLGEAVDRRCDVFALGIVAFELATHQRLFKRSSDYLTARAILEEDIPRADAVDPAVPAALADVIAKALAREPAQRYATARELGEAVRAAIAPASAGEIAAVVTATDELTAQRTRQQRVLGEARSREVGTRRFVPALDEAPTTIARRARAPIGWIAVGVLVAAVLAVVALWPRADEPSPTLALPPQAPPSIVVAPQQVEPPVGPKQPVVVAEVPRRPPPPAFGQLSIDSTPFATVFLDGSRLGVTPILKRRVPAGKHRLRATLSDGRTKELAIEVPANGLAPPLQLRW